MTFELEVVTESTIRKRGDVYPAFDQDLRFDPDWWHRGSVASPVSFCRFLDHGEEVGRAKILLEAGEYGGYTSWSCPAGGVTEIDLIEIRADLRRSAHRYGRRAVEAIGQVYGYPIVAMSLDETSERFWRSLGWTAHTDPDDDEYHHSRTLFTSA